MEPSLKTIAERKAYLAQIEQDIEAVTLAGNDRLRDLMGEIDQADQERVRLLRLNYGLEQEIRERKHILAQL